MLPPSPFLLSRLLPSCSLLTRPSGAPYGEGGHGSSVLRPRARRGYRPAANVGPIGYCTGLSHPVHSTTQPSLPPPTAGVSGQIYRDTHGIAQRFSSSRTLLCPFPSSAQRSLLSRRSPGSASAMTNLRSNSGKAEDSAAPPVQPISGFMVRCGFTGARWQTGFLPLKRGAVPFRQLIGCCYFQLNLAPASYCWNEIERRLPLDTVGRRGLDLVTVRAATPYSRRR